MGNLIWIIIVWIFLRTASYGVWTWKSNNKSGGIAVFLVALIELVLPVYWMFFYQY